MHTIKLNVSDTIFDKVMFFLENLPQKEIQLKVENNEIENRDKENLVDFFRNSPLDETIELQRNNELYDDRIGF